jgi:thioredoxin-related protein
MIKILTVLIFVFSLTACSQHAQTTQSIEADNGSITLDTDYILYVIDKNAKKYKFKLEKGQKTQVKDGIETYIHDELGSVKVLQKVKYSERAIGGGWDYSDALSY